MRWHGFSLHGVEEVHISKGSQGELDIRVSGENKAGTITLFTDNERLKVTVEAGVLEEPEPKGKPESFGEIRERFNRSGLVMVDSEEEFESSLKESFPNAHSEFYDWARQQRKDMIPF